MRVITDDAARRAGVLVVFTDRAGGVSEQPYASLNLAVSVGDDLAAVEENRTRMGAAVGFDIAALVLARQVHGTRVVEAKAGDSGRDR